MFVLHREFQRSLPTTTTGLENTLSTQTYTLDRCSITYSIVVRKRNIYKSHHPRFTISFPHQFLKVFDRHIHLSVSSPRSSNELLRLLLTVGKESGTSQL